MKRDIADNTFHIILISYSTYKRLKPFKINFHYADLEFDITTVLNLWLSVLFYLCKRLKHNQVFIRSLIFIGYLTYTRDWNLGTRFLGPQAICLFYLYKELILIVTAFCCSVVSFLFYLYKRSKLLECVLNPVSMAAIYFIPHRNQNSS